MPAVTVPGTRMGILDDLADLALPRADVPVEGIAVGVHYTAVRSRWVGLAATGGCSRPADDALAAWLERLRGLPARDLLALLRSDQPVERSIGLATLNSLVGTPPDAIAVPDGHSLLYAHACGRRVALIGRFRFAAGLAGVARDVTVLELDPADGERPASDAPAVLATAEVVAVTGTTLLNGTFDGLVPLFAPGATVIVLGPSTPVSPVLFDHRVDIVAGLAVDDPRGLLAAVAQGASRRQLGGTRPVVLARSGALLRP